MTVSTLAVSTCVLWGVCGFIAGATSVIMLGLHINKKAAMKKAAEQSGENR